MSNTPFTIERIYNAPVEKVWKAITDKDEMKKWYFDLGDFKPEVGFEFTFYGTGSDGEKYLHLCKITHAIPMEKLRYSWSYQNYPGMSYVTFELFPEEGNRTRLKLTHEGLETFPTLKDFARESFAAGWTEIIGKHLKNFVES